MSALSNRGRKQSNLKLGVALATIVLSSAPSAQEAPIPEPEFPRIVIYGDGSSEPDASELIRALDNVERMTRSKPTNQFLLSSRSGERGKVGEAASFWAKSQVGSTDYQITDFHPEIIKPRLNKYIKGPIDRVLGTLLKPFSDNEYAIDTEFLSRSSTKCNCFVADAFENAGVEMNIIPMPGGYRIPTVSDYTNRGNIPFREIIPGFYRLPEGSIPEEGDIVVAGGHMGIAAYYNVKLSDSDTIRAIGTVHAASNTRELVLFEYLYPINSYVKFNSWPYNYGHKTVVWRYNEVENK